MLYVEILLISLSLAMDALAVAITIGICRAGLRKRHAAKVALFFGGFQALMPAIGYLAGVSVADLIAPVDHWVAFALLAFVGGRMLYGVLHGEPEADEVLACPPDDPVATRPLLLMAVATSIDALAAGISLALGQLPVTATIATIGIVTAVLSGMGVLLGRRLGFLFQRYACLAGGSILILIGVKILLQDLLA